MNTLDWRRIASGVGARRHTVYWMAQCGLFRLTVARVYNDDGSYTPGGPWRWTLRERNGNTKPETVLAEAFTGTVQAGKRAATSAMFATGPSDGR